jgi:hypothetical protein
MLSRIFPECIDNRYRGLTVALWLLLPIALMKVGISLTHIFGADGGAQSVATIPLDTYPAGAAQNVIALLARLGLEQFLLGALVVVVLLRYRAMIPLLYLLIVVHDIAYAGIARMKPLALAGTSGARTPALVLTVLSVSGLILSLWGKDYKNQRG